LALSKQTIANLAKSMRVPKAKDFPYSKPIYLATLMSAVSTGMGGPYIAVYAAKLGATVAQLGLLHSLLNLFSNFLQPLWGFLSDRFQKRKNMIIVSWSLASFTWLIMLIPKDPSRYLLLASLQALFNSIASPAWIGLIGLLIPVSHTGFIMAYLSFLTSLGSLTATLVSGILPSILTLQGLRSYYLAFILAFLTGVISAVLIYPIREPKAKSSKVDFKASFLSAFSNDAFSTFVKIALIDGFFLSLPWPLFTLVIANELRLRILEVALLSVVSGSSLTLIQQFLGWLIDEKGRKPFILLSKGALIFFPLLYAFVPNFDLILAFTGLLNALVALGRPATLAYLLDITPLDQRGIYSSIYNMLMGLGLFFGSLTGGFMVSACSNFLGSWLATRFGFLMASLGRLIVLILYFKYLREA